MTEGYSEEYRREVFRVLVEAQDNGASVAESRNQVAAQFGISASDVLLIEQEGIANQWPPL